MGGYYIVVKEVLNSNASAIALALSLTLSADLDQLPAPQFSK